MPPKAKLSDDEKVARLTQTANKLKSKSLVDKIVKVLKSKPGLVASVVDHLANLGVKIQDGAKNPSSSSPAGSKRSHDDDDDDDPSSPDYKTPDAKRTRSMASLAAAASSAASETGGESIISDNDPATSPGKVLDVIPRKYDTFFSLPPTTSATSWQLLNPSAWATTPRKASQARARRPSPSRAPPRLARARHGCAAGPGDPPLDAQVV